MDIKEFRAAHNLPPEFSIALFEPKDFTGLATINRTKLNELSNTLLDALPQSITLSELMSFTGNLSNLFRVKLYEINDAIGLKPVEIDFAYAGFEDVCQAWLYAMIQARTQKTAEPDISKIYDNWLRNSVRISQTRHLYHHNGIAWEIQIINNAYGRAGLIIETETGTYEVRDTSLACPAEGFMAQLLAAVLSKLQTAVK